MEKRKQQSKKDEGEQGEPRVKPTKREKPSGGKGGQKVITPTNEQGKKGKRKVPKPNVWDR